MNKPMLVKPFACFICNNAFINTARLKVHERINTGEKPFTCSKCDKAIQQNCDLKEHERAHHTGQKPFAFSKWITIPMIVHIGEKYCCKQCGKNLSYLLFLQQKYAKFLVTLFAIVGFLTNVFFQIHERTHTVEKPFACYKYDKTLKKCSFK